MAIAAAAGLTFRANLGGGVTLQNTAATTGLRSAVFTLNADGSCTYSPASGAASSVTLGVATDQLAGLYVRFTVSGALQTTYPNSTPGTWYLMSSGGARSFGVQNSGSNLEGTGTWTISIATDAAGTNIIATISGGLWDVGYVT